MDILFQWYCSKKLAIHSPKNLETINTARCISSEHSVYNLHARKHLPKKGIQSERDAKRTRTQKARVNLLLRGAHSQRHNHLHTEQRAIYQSQSRWRLRRQGWPHRSAILAKIRSARVEGHGKSRLGPRRYQSPLSPFLILILRHTQNNEIFRL
jgi:hypothetical protein